jgi:CBS domain containing-hemolysin-like protein
MIIILLFCILILTCISAFCSLSEIAYFSLPSARVKSWSHQLDPKKRLASKLLAHSQSLLVTIFLMNTVVNILVQNISSGLFDKIGGGWLIKVAVPLALILIFGELFPKYLGLIYNEPCAVASSTFFDRFQRLTKPLRELIFHVAYFFSRILFFFLKTEKPLSEDELGHILETSRNRGLVIEEETKLLKGYLSLEDKQVIDIMTPRGEIIGYDINAPLETLGSLFSKNRVSHVVVFRSTLDNFVGLIDARDFLIHRTEIQKPDDLTKFLYTTFFVPETTPVKMVSGQFEKHAQDIALVVDEYGAISGTISKRELLGVLAKHYLSRGEKEYTWVARNAIIANGQMALAELEELFHTVLESAYHQVTCGGFLIEKLGTIPKSGATWQEGSCFFRVLDASPTKIGKIYIQNGESV